MDPIVGDPFPAERDIHVIPTYWPVPNAGVIPMNAFLVKSDQPVLVDSGTAALGDEFLEALASIIDPSDVRWIWLTHEDRDHTGSLTRLLELAPQAQVATAFMAIGRLMPEMAIPLDRVRLVNPGETLNVGDRNLRALRPPLYDSPATTGFLDDRSGALFSSDCFGAPLPTLEEAAVHDAGEVAPEVLRQGQVAWATVDSPWVTTVDRGRFATALDQLKRLSPATILSSHLPPVRDRLDQVCAALAAAPNADPVPGMVQSELEAMLAQFELVS